MTITSSVDFGAAQTGVGYRAFGVSGALAARVTSGITNPDGGFYVASSVTAPTGTIFIQWSCDDSSLTCNDSDIFLRSGDTLKTDAQTTLGTAGAGLTALGDSRLANLDSTVSSRSSHTAADVWAVTTRTLSSFGSLVSDIWENATRTLTAFAFDVSSEGQFSDEDAAAITAAATRINLVPDTSEPVALIPDPSGASQTMAYIWTRDELGNLANNVPIKFQLVSAPAGSGDSWPVGKTFTIKSVTQDGNDGFAGESVPKGARFLVSRGSGRPVTFLASETEAKSPIPPVLGNL
jgi:hypothetical protein